MTTAAHGPSGFPVVGIIGDGQLARMMAAPAEALAIGLRLLADSADASAAQVIPDVVLGSYTDVATVRAFAAGCDAVTFDHEHVPADVLAALIADGVAVNPGPHALRFAQDKTAMRARLDELGLPNPRWALARTVADADRFSEEVGWPLIAKTPTGGYDGKGVLLAQRSSDLTEWLARAAASDTPLLLEERVAFDRELAVLLARSPSGQAAVWPVVETIQRDGICAEVLAPAPGLSPELSAEATRVGLSLADQLGVTGVLAVELFQVGETILVNELAMRPHNSGHWTIDGSRTSQFEQHLRAVLDLPLGDPQPTAPVSVMANVLGGDYPDLYAAYPHVLAHDPSLKVHLYGKAVKPGRKVGHVTACGDSLASLRARAGHAADYFQGAVTQ